MALRKIPVRRRPLLNKSAYDMFGVKPQERRLELLRQATPKEVVYPSYRYWTTGLPVHCEGGVALKNPDVKWLQRKGYIKMARTSPLVTQSRNLKYPIKLWRTYMVITDEGRVALERGKL